jgi:hypothetical protein
MFGFRKSLSHECDEESVCNVSLASTRTARTFFAEQSVIEAVYSQENSGGEGGIRTPGTSFSSYNGLANRRLQPLGHLSGVGFQ